VRVPRPANEKGKGAYWTFASSASEKTSQRKSHYTANAKDNAKELKQAPACFEHPFIAPKDELPFEITNLSPDQAFTSFLDISTDNHISYVTSEPTFSSAQRDYLSDPHSASAIDPTAYTNFWTPDLTYGQQYGLQDFYPVYECPSSSVGHSIEEDAFNTSFTELEWINHDQCEDFSETSETK
jgi:hypothetical protein